MNKEFLALGFLIFCVILLVINYTIFNLYYNRYRSKDDLLKVTVEHHLDNNRKIYDFWSNGESLPSLNAFMGVFAVMLPYVAAGVATYSLYNYYNRTNDLLYVVRSNNTY